MTSHTAVHDVRPSSSTNEPLSNHLTGCECRTLIDMMGKTKSSSKPPGKKRKSNKDLSKNLTELAEIFAASKKKKIVKASKKERTEKQATVKGSKEDLFGVKEGKHSRRKTGDGLAIYSEEELQLDVKNSGTTDLCPFDCWCCF